MNLLDKKKHLGAVVLGLFFFISCEKNGPFGLSSRDVDPVNFTAVNIPISSSVVWLDSIGSSNRGVLLVGEVNSSTFGRIRATSYSRLNLNRAKVGKIPSKAVFDSARLHLKFNYSFDTVSASRDFSYDAFRVAKEIPNKLLVTKSAIAVTDELFAESTIKVPKLDSVYTTPWNETWARQLHKLFKDEDKKVKTQKDFDSFFEGISFSAKAGFDQNIFGISLGEKTKLTLYYRNPGTDGKITVAKTHDLSFAKVPGFYNLSIDRKGTPLEFLKEHHVEYVPASGKRYVQSGAGIVTKINLSEFKKIIVGEPRIINLAEISVGPIDELDDQGTPPPRLYLALTDDQNTLIRDLKGRPKIPFRAIQSDGQNPINNRSPVTLNYNKKTRTYSASVTSYFQNYFAGNFQRNEFFIYPGNMNTSVNGISFDAEDIKLKVIFSELQ